MIQLAEMCIQHVTTGSKLASLN